MQSSAPGLLSGQGRHLETPVCTIAAPSMDNALDPSRMTASERLDEVAAILAAGIMGMKARRKNQNPYNIKVLREVSLDFSAEPTRPVPRSNGYNGSNPMCRLSSSTNRCRSLTQPTASIS